jgi:transposase-like protein
MNESQEVRKRKRRSREEVKRQVMEFAGSGLTVTEFCRQQGLATSTLRRSLARSGLGINGQRKGANQEHSELAGSRLLSVELSRQEKRIAESCALEVVLPKGRRIAVRADFDCSTLSRVVRVLEGL